MAHAGYEQLSAAADLPAQVRRRALAEIANLHQAALATLASRAFSKAEAHLIRASAADAQASADELRKATS
jgi:hypothetical protein